MTLDKVIHEAKRITIQPEPHIPFPQANSRIAFVKTLGLLDDSDSDDENDKGLTGTQISSELGYSKRQGEYYGDLSIYLGLAYKNKSKFHLNSSGHNLYLQFNSNQGRLALIKLLLSHKPFMAVFSWFTASETNLKLAYQNKISKDNKFDIGEKILSYGGMYGIDPNKSTFIRRVESTISLVKSCIFDVLE